MKEKAKCNYSLFSQYRAELMGIAALLIVVFHSGTFLHPENISYSLNFILSHLDIGVEIFLILSGMGLYFALSKKSFDFKQYYSKRILNVYVIYLIIALPIILFNSISFGGSFFDFVMNWTGFAFYFGKSYPLGVHGAWYVMFMMIMYLIYPLIFKVQKFLEKKKADLLFLISFSVIYILFCFYIFKQFNIFQRYEIAATRVPVFLVGSYIGKLAYNKKKFGIGTYITLIAGIIVFLFLSYFDVQFILSRFNQLLLSVSLCMIYVLIRSSIEIKWLSAFFSFFGKMSLELYLTHNLANAFLFKKGHCDNIFTYSIIVLVSIIVSFFISKLRMKMISNYNSLINKEKN